MPKYSSLASLRLPLFASACLILALQAGASHMLKVDEGKIGVPGLHGLPWRIDHWQASNEQSIGPEVEAYLKPDEYILRDYADERGGAGISLFVAYFKSLQNTYGPHSPRICLPGSGWLVSSSKIVNIPVPGHPDGIPANRFTMEKANQRILVLYWYQNDRDVWAEEYHAKLRLLPDLIRYRRSDVSLVRLITPLNGSTAEKELANCVQFTQHLFPDLAGHFASVSTRP
ncbi:MAG: exosortase C-terminal domain/associated protein EpsI [Bryobacteraceae bacterium]